MRDALHFNTRTNRKWGALDGSIRAQFKKVLARQLEEPHILSARFADDLRDCYTIKPGDVGYQFAYRVDDGKILILVIATGRRDGEAIYRNAAKLS